MDHYIAAKKGYRTNIIIHHINVITKIQEKRTPKESPKTTKLQMFYPPPSGLKQNSTFKHGYCTF